MLLKGADHPGADEPEADEEAGREAAPGGCVECVTEPGASGMPVGIGHSEASRAVLPCSHGSPRRSPLNRGVYAAELPFRK